MTSPGYQRVDATGWTLMEAEPGGLSEHEWLEDSEGKAWLFKPVVVHGERRQGEDWAEKISGEIGKLLGVPCARVELATRGDRQGVVSLDLRPKEWSLHAGAVLLSGIVKDYHSGTKDRAGHSLPNIQRALRNFAVPPSTSFPDVFAAFDVFVGYLVFDALVANQDRHDHNWSVLEPPPEMKEGNALCGSYDHASSLGFGIDDDRRSYFLRDQSVEVWAARGRALKFEHDLARGAPTLIELAREGLDAVPRKVREHWVQSVEALTRAQIERVVASVPLLSDITATFALEVMWTNRRRVLDEC